MRQRVVGFRDLWIGRGARRDAAVPDDCSMDWAGLNPSEEQTPTHPDWTK